MNLKSWKNKPCLILGCGSSMKDFEVPDYSRIIAVNRAINYGGASVFFSMDTTFHFQIKHGLQDKETIKAWDEFKGKKLYLLANYPENNYDFGDDKVVRVKDKGIVGISKDWREGLYHGCNSGFGALNLALALGCNPIYLAGFDMGGENNGYPVATTPGQWDAYYSAFVSLKYYMDKLKINTEIYLATRGSRLSNLFPYKEFRYVPTSKKRNKWILVSYYTPAYQHMALWLMRSVSANRIPFECSPIGDRGSWDKNTRHKAILIKKTLLERKKPLLFVDADSIVKKYPILIDTIKADIAAVFRTGLLLSGTLYMDYNEHTLKLVDRWIELDEINPTALEQANLQQACEEMKSEISLVRLPPEYARIFDVPPDALGIHKREDVVVEAYLASRYYNEKQNLPDTTKYHGVEYGKYLALWTSGKYANVKPNSIQCEKCISGIVKNGEKCLNIGCGSGVVTYNLRRQNVNCSGVDITLAGLTGEQRWFTEAPAWKMPFPDNSFDISFSADVLEHIPTELIDMTILEILRVTKSSTYHVIADYEDECNGEIMHLTVKPIAWWREKFEKLNTRKITCKVFDQNGFKQITKDGRNPFKE